MQLRTSTALRLRSGCGCLTGDDGAVLARARREDRTSESELRAELRAERLMSLPERLWNRKKDRFVSSLSESSSNTDWGSEEVRTVDSSMSRLRERWWDGGCDFV